MTVDEIVAFTETLGSVFAQRPEPGDPTVPDLAWGDTFFYVSSDGEIPPRTQPFATIVTKAYPGEPDSDLDRDGAFRVNISVSPGEFRARIGTASRDTDRRAYLTRDTLGPHPTYPGWISIIDPHSTDGVVRELLRSAHRAASTRRARTQSD